jgi:NAD(P)-dependent dehydrogenase (short-subunit alcohol dehydrogenase family)
MTQLKYYVITCSFDVTVNIVFALFSCINKLHYEHEFCFQELSSALSSESGKLFPLKCDVIRETDIKDAFKWVRSNLGGVDILVNNAGVASENSLMGEQV